MNDAVEPLGGSPDAVLATYRPWRLRAEVVLIPPDIRELGGTEIVARGDTEDAVIALFLDILCGERDRRPSQAVTDAMRAAPIAVPDGRHGGCWSTEVYRRCDSVTGVGARLVLVHEPATPAQHRDWAATLVHWGVDEESKDLYVVRVSRAAATAESARTQVLDASRWVPTIDHGSLSNALRRRVWRHSLSVSGGQLYGDEPRFAHVTIDERPLPPPVRAATKP